MDKRHIGFLVTILITLLIGYQFYRDYYHPLIDEYEALGTTVCIKIYDHKSRAQKTALEIRSKLVYLESVSNLLDTASEVARLNHQRQMKVSPELFALLDRSMYYAHWSAGAYDPTVGALTLAYRVGEGGILPTTADIVTLRTGVGYGNLKLYRQSREVKLTHPLTKVDVWGVVKGYAADQVLTILRQNKIKAALIDLGGQISVYGQRPFQSAWKVGIEDPRSLTKMLKVVTLNPGETMATSSSVYRREVRAGRSLSHIFDPRHVELAEHYLSVSIISPSGTDADILSTAVYVLGSVDKLKLIPQVRYVVLTNSGKIITQ